MIKTAATAAAILVAASSSAAMAQGITGGELGIEYNAPLNGSDFGGTTYSGGLEYGFMDMFSVSGNIAAYKFDNLGTDASNITLHGTYFLSSTTAVGAFYGHDDLEGDNAHLYGIEGRMDLFGTDVGGYLGKVDGDGDSGTILGLDGSYALRSGFSIIGNLDLVDADDDTLSQIAAGVEYQMMSGPEFYAQIGHAELDSSLGSESAGFVTVGAKVAFGQNRGTTFDNRSLLEAVPGF